MRCGCAKVRWGCGGAAVQCCHVRVPNTAIRLMWSRLILVNPFCQRCFCFALTWKTELANNTATRWGSNLYLTEIVGHETFEKDDAPRDPVPIDIAVSVNTCLARLVITGMYVVTQQATNMKWMSQEVLVVVSWKRLGNYFGAQTRQNKNNHNQLYPK